MKNEGKKGQIDLSFGFIFGIIIVIATVAVAFYAITYFLNIQKCANIGLFYNNLGSEINKSWVANGETINKPFTRTVPESVKSVCFGNLSSIIVSSDSKEQYMVLKKKFEGEEKNVFLYPTKSACNQGSFNLQHIKVDRFFCINQTKGKVTVKISR